MVTGVPAVLSGFEDCTQKVLAVAVSTHWCSIVWLGPRVRAVPASQSWPTPATIEPLAVGVRVTVGAPGLALLMAVAPTPAAPA
jgi:hypothetical protein